MGFRPTVTECTTLRVDRKMIERNFLYKLQTYMRLQNVQYFDENVFSVNVHFSFGQPAIRTIGMPPETQKIVFNRD